MRAVAQRVSEARVEVEAEIVGQIGVGLLVYLGTGKDDTQREVEWMANKLAGLRIFRDDDGKMSRDVQEAHGEVLVVSQFTLYGDVRKGRRPSFDSAGPPESAKGQVEAVCARLRALGLRVHTGRFQAMMNVHAVVDGPVTILIDSDKTF